MKETLISFETAVLAKNKSFDWKVAEFYLERDGSIWEGGEFIEPTNHNEFPDVLSAPTQSLLQKWLREVHSLKLCISWIESDNYLFEINHKEDAVSGYAAYEEALEAGLKESLKLLK